MSEHIYKFNKPYSFEGVEHKELDLNLDSLTGRQLSAAKSELAGRGIVTMMTSTDQDYHIMLAKIATGKPVEFFDDMPAGDYSKIAQKVQGFLLA